MTSAEHAREQQADEGEQGESERHLARQHRRIRQKEAEDESRDRGHDENEKRFGVHFE